MKSYKITSLFFIFLIAIFSNNCKKILKEEPRALIVPSFLATPSGLLGGIAGVYNDIRSQWGTEGFSEFAVGGTDEHLMGASNSAPKFFTYNGLASADMNGSFWGIAYQDINTLNGILEFGASAAMDAALKQQYLAQAKFLRAFWYFHLVQTFGDVPLHTTFITTPSAADSRQPIADVYNQIIKDLTEASSELQVSSPATSTAAAPFGGKAAGQATAKYLLAKVYLTRGWLNNTAADFQQAYSIASALVTSKATYGADLWQDYADAFKPANDYGKETLFTSDHSSDTKYGQYTPAASGGAAQNLTPWFNRWNYPSLATINSYVSGGVLKSDGPTAMTRDVANGRPYIRIRPNNYVWPGGSNAGKNYLFDEAFADRINDSRYDKTFQTVWIANTSNVSNTVASAHNLRGIAYTMTVGGDTAVWMPDHEVTGAPQFNEAAPFKGIIIPPSLWSNSYYPAVKKFDDVSRTGVNDPSTRPVVMYRFSDVYLVAAEAAFKAGDLTNAAAMINVVRQRAAYRSSNTPAQNTAAAAAVTITPAQVTLDFILDERTREFYGEWQRWWDLARTRTLLARTTAWNPEAAPYIKSFHVLRPIPQQQIDLVTEGPKFPQNPGY
ncbi:MAG: RagB/SusD family nutrient uptake outer membrane protein [Bacteroidetes bacterium]|nr:MAG: RagB/SusD family nutrient uptake outer membrane protein [Bacteroidota bacterium]